MTVQEIKEELKNYFDSDFEINKYDMIISSVILYIKSIVKDEESLENTTLFALAVMISYYRISLLICDKYSQIKAGELEVQSANNALYCAKILVKSYFKECSTLGLIKSDEFYFGVM